MTDISKKHKLLREEFFNQLAFLLSGDDWGKDLYKKVEEKPTQTK